jgi:hypothetical protein
VAVKASRPAPRDPTVQLIRAEMERQELTPGRLGRLIDADASHLFRVLVGERPLSPSLARRITAGLIKHAESGR